MKHRSQVNTRKIVRGRMLRLWTVFCATCHAQCSHHATSRNAATCAFRREGWRKGAYGWQCPKCRTIRRPYPHPLDGDPRVVLADDGELHYANGGPRTFCGRPLAPPNKGVVHNSALCKPCSDRFWSKP